MTEPISAYDPPEGTSPDLTAPLAGAPDDADAPLGADDLPLEAEVADVLEQRAVVPAGAEEHRGRDGAPGGGGFDGDDAPVDDDEDEA